MLSWLFNNATETPNLQSNTVLQQSPEIIIDTFDIAALLERCNEKWLRTKSWKLEKQSNICYTLTNQVLKDVWLIYIKPIYNMREVIYDIGVKQVYHPHIQTADRFQQILEGHEIPITFYNKQVLQIGKESMSLYLSLKGTEFRETDNIADALA